MKSLNVKTLNSCERSELVDTLLDVKKYSNEWIRRQVIDNDRIDILGEILGLKIMPFHIKMLQFQIKHPENLILVFRSSGKTTVCTILKTIHLLLKNPELRICIVSKTQTNAEAFLKEIKGHYETNERFAEIFGKHYDPKEKHKWDAREINVLTRKRAPKEASITCVGVGGMVVGKHYDTIIADDILDEENTRTKAMRKKIKDWYYQSLTPTLDPPTDEIACSGLFHKVGTRYHYDDLYGHLIDSELKEHHLVIPALNEYNQTPWPERNTVEWLLEMRRRMGLILFGAQYQNNTEAMKGEIFEYENCQQIAPDMYPEKLDVFMGIDLAISEKESADKFAIVVVGMLRHSETYFLLDYYESRLRFSEQTTKILEYYDKWNPIRACIETNAYQLAKYQDLKQVRKGIRLRAVNQTKDKVTRAWKLSAIFDDNRMFFKKGLQDSLIEQLVLFPSYVHDDMFDALDLAVRASRMRKKRRKKEPKLM